MKAIHAMGDRLSPCGSFALWREEVRGRSQPWAAAEHAFGALALVVHEMMTNAAKYGALSVPDRRLTLSWTLADDGDCVIEWLERGGPPVARPTREGFGSKLVRNTIGYDLGGAFAIEYRPEGVWARFVIPAARLAEQTLSARP